MFSPEQQRLIRQMHTVKAAAQQAGDKARLAKAAKKYAGTKPVKAPKRRVDPPHVQKAILETLEKPMGLDETFDALLAPVPPVPVPDTSYVKQIQAIHEEKEKELAFMDGNDDALSPEILDNLLGKKEEWKPATQEEMDAFKASAEPYEPDPPMIVLGESKKG